CWANVNRLGHGNQFHTHPGALWSATYYVDDGGIGADPSLGGEFEIQDPRGVAPVMYAPYLTFPGPDGLALGEAQRLTPRAGVCDAIHAKVSAYLESERAKRDIEPSPEESVATSYYKPDVQVVTDAELHELEQFVIGAARTFLEKALRLPERRLEIERSWINV